MMKGMIEAPGNGSTVLKFSVRRIDGDAAAAHLRKRIPDLRSWREYYVELAEEPSPELAQQLAEAFANPVIETVTVNETLAPGCVQVTYKRGIVDNENDSIVALCALVGVQALAAKVATAYASEDPNLAAFIGAEACNHTIEELHDVEPEFDSLLPQGRYEPVRRYDLRPMDEVALIDLGRENGRVLELDKMHAVRDIQLQLDLPYVTDVMLEALDARWSDHCAHTTWKSLGNLLKRLIDAARASGNPNIVSMFHDNAGIWDFYDGWGIAFKAETHNGPSAVSAYFGQLTKLGGVLRDILGTGLGADPIGSFEYTATGLPSSPSPIEGRPAPTQVAHETIRAIKEYGNTFGVPMMWSHMTFHDAYRAKPFALGGSIGLIPIEHAQKGTPQPGDHVVLIGGLTGNDGIHGASGSSAGAVMDATSVQIGSPLEEIKFREAILALRDAGCIRAITDLGAAGINSAVGEMGESTGVWINTALVPLKTGELPMWRILLSESQERMAMAIAPDRMQEARHILQQHEVRTTVIGRFTSDHCYTVVHDDDLTEKHVMEFDVTQLPEAREVGFSLPYDVLSYLPAQLPVGFAEPVSVTATQWPELTTQSLPQLVSQMVADLELADQSYAALQYDSSVQGRTLYGPHLGERFVPSGYYAQRPVYGHPGALIFNTSFNPWLYGANPVLAARQHFLSILAGQVLAGSAIGDVCLCDNFYTPHLETNWENWLSGMVIELATLSELFGVPFISGKDSSAGSTDTDEGVVSVPPAVFLSALGKVPDAAQLRPEVWTKPGNLLVRIGVSTPSLAGTVADRVFGTSATDVDDVDVSGARSFITSLAALSLAHAPSGRLLGTGGIIGACVLGSLASGLGVELDVPAEGLQGLVQEHRIGALVEVPQALLSEIPPALSPVIVGHIVDNGGRVRVDGVELLTDDAIARWSQTFEEELA
jgi:phosphoribosylformylglycinamidine (FGAM) synthase-like enzyme